MTVSICDFLNYDNTKNTHLTDDVGHGVSGFDAATALCVDPQSHMDVREALLVGIVLRILRQRLEEKEE